LPFFEKSVKAATRYKIEITIPEGNTDVIGCVSIMVGNRPTLSRAFSK